MKMNFLLLITILLTTVTTNGYKILQISLLPSKSHHNLNVGIMSTLNNAGHEVTMISPFHKPDLPCRQFSVTETQEFFDKFGMSGFEMSKMSIMESMKKWVLMQQKLAEAMMSHEGIANMFSNKTETFDLIIVEFFSSDFLFGLSIKYDCPIIVLSPVGMVNTLSTITGNPASIATLPNMLLEIPPEMTLWQRTQNLLIHVMLEVIEMFMTTPTQNDLYLKYFPEESKIESFSEVKKRISLIFMNTHPSIGLSRPLLPNVIEIGGYHIIDDPKPLDEELQKIMDSAKDGVIYFSLGSIVQGNRMEEELKNAVIKSFSKLKQTVLWKFEEDLPDVPKNVIIRKWMPQNSILNHPNLKMFITHGGLLSCTEAVHFGVPLIVIPVFGDQPYNAEMVAYHGHGLRLRMYNVTESSLDWAINEVLNNKKYTERAKEIQGLYYDRPMTPHESIKYYADHVIRTKGAKHLSPPKLPPYSLLLLDVYALILTILVIVFYLIRSLVRMVFRKIFGSGKTNIQNKLKNN